MTEIIPKQIQFPNYKWFTLAKSFFGVSRPSWGDTLLCSGAAGFTLDGDTKTAPPGKMQRMAGFKPSHWSHRKSSLHESCLPITNSWSSKIVMSPLDPTQFSQLRSRKPASRSWGGFRRRIWPTNWNNLLGSISSRKYNQKHLTIIVQYQGIKLVRKGHFACENNNHQIHMQSRGSRHTQKSGKITSQQ